MEGFLTIIHICFQRGNNISGKIIQFQEQIYKFFNKLKLGRIIRWKISFYPLRISEMKLSF